MGFLATISISSTITIHSRFETIQNKMSNNNTLPAEATLQAWDDASENLSSPSDILQHIPSTHTIHTNYRHFSIKIQKK